MLTGGLHSPLLVAFFSPMVGSLVVFGRGKPTRIIAGFMVIGTCFMALAPQRWFGPVVPDPYSTWVTLWAVVVSVLLMWTSMTALIEAFREKGAALLRVREEVMEQALARAKGLEQVGSKVAHELKNPLAAVKGLVQLMARNCPGPAESKAKERLAVVEREVARMETILAEYLSFSRPLEDLNAQEIDVDAVATDVLAVLEARAHAAQVTLSNEGQARAFADPRRLKEALLNLVANALEFTPPGGTVAVQHRGDARRRREVVGQGFRPRDDAGSSRSGRHSVLHHARERHRPRRDARARGLHPARRRAAIREQAGRWHHRHRRSSAARNRMPGAIQELRWPSCCWSMTNPVSSSP